MILALDIATTTGWAVRLPGGVIRSGSVNLRKNTARDIRMVAREMYFLLNVLARFYGEPDIIAFEDVKRHVAWKAAKRYWSLLTMVEYWTIEEARFVPMMPLAIHAIKIHATGRGNASKDEMMQAARAKGWQFKDDNEADALFILDLAAQEIKKGKA